MESREIYDMMLERLQLRKQLGLAPNEGPEGLRLADLRLMVKGLAASFPPVQMIEVTPPDIVWCEFCGQDLSRSIMHNDNTCISCLSEGAGIHSGYVHWRQFDWDRSWGGYGISVPTHEPRLGTPITGDLHFMCIDVPGIRKRLIEGSHWSLVHLMKEPNKDTLWTRILRCDAENALRHITGKRS